jgi:rubrerythrin
LNGKEQAMRFQTVRNILDFVRDFHARASRLFEAASAQVRQEKAHWLLSWLADHERRFAEAIAAFEAAPENSPLLAGWLQFAPEAGRLPTDLPAFGTEMSVDDAVTIAIAFDDYLVRLYESVLATCSSREVCEVFKGLLAQERAEERATARNLAQLQDL